MTSAGLLIRTQSANEGRPLPVRYAVMLPNWAHHVLPLLGVSFWSPHLAGLLRSYGAEPDASAADELLAACMNGDLEKAASRVERDPGLPGGLTDAEQAGALVRAALTGNAAAAAVMLELGFAAEAPGEHGATPLHLAAYAGSAEVAELLLGRGASLEATDGEWNSTPLDWALVGSGEQPRGNPAADWVRTVEALIDAGASTAGVTLAADDPKPPSAAVAGYLRARGIGTADQADTQ
jgi:ankyrin repeat protein